MKNFIMQIVFQYHECGNFFSGLREFLDSSATQLQAMFDRVCGFRYSNECLTNEVVHVVDGISKMKDSAVELRHASSSSYFISKGMLCY